MTCRRIPGAADRRAASTRPVPLAIAKGERVDVEAFVLGNGQDRGRVQAPAK